VAIALGVVAESQKRPKSRGVDEIDFVEVEHDLGDPA